MIAPLGVGTSDEIIRGVGRRGGTRALRHATIAGRPALLHRRSTCPLGASGGRDSLDLHARPAGPDGIAVGVRPPDADELEAVPMLLDQVHELLVGEGQARGPPDVVEAMRPVL